MFLEGGWRPRQDPEPGPPRLPERDERTLMALIVVLAVLLLVAPIGGGTLVQLLLR